MDRVIVRTWTIGHIQMQATAYKKQLLRKTFLSGMLNHLHPKNFQRY